MTQWIAVPLGIVASVLAAEFVAGLIHWMEDTYGDPDGRFFGRWVVRPNVVHHHFPRHFLRNNWWRSSWDLVLGAVVLGVVAWALGLLCWQVVLFLAVGANANQFHKWGHGIRRENPRVVAFLQSIRVIQTPAHHARHHTDPKSSHYCVITELLNPLLDRVRFWRRLEWCVLMTTGIRRRFDTSVRGGGPMPAWLEAYRPHRVSQA